MSDLDNTSIHLIKIFTLQKPRNFSIFFFDIFFLGLLEFLDTFLVDFFWVSLIFLDTLLVGSVIVKISSFFVVFWSFEPYPRFRCFQGTIFLWNCLLRFYVVDETSIYASGFIWFLRFFVLFRFSVLIVAYKYTKEAWCRNLIMLDTR